MVNRVGSIPVIVTPSALPAAGVGRAPAPSIGASSFTRTKPGDNDLQAWSPAALPSPARLDAQRVAFYRVMQVISPVVSAHIPDDGPGETGLTPLLNSPSTDRDFGPGVITGGELERLLVQGRRLGGADRRILSVILEQLQLRGQVTFRAGATSTRLQEIVSELRKFGADAPSCAEQQAGTLMASVAAIPGALGRLLPNHGQLDDRSPAQEEALRVTLAAQLRTELAQSPRGLADIVRGYVRGMLEQVRNETSPGVRALLDLVPPFVH